MGDLGVLAGVFLALAGLGVPFGVCVAFMARLMADFVGVGSAFGFVTFLRIVRSLGGRGDRSRKDSVLCRKFDALTCDARGSTGKGFRVRVEAVEGWLDRKDTPKRSRDLSNHQQQ